MTQYPNDGKQHPDLSDFFRGIAEALREAGPTPYLFIFFVVAILGYPDWRTIIGTGLILMSIWGITYVRSRSR